jgi:hypothetical protein
MWLLGGGARAPALSGSADAEHVPEDLVRTRRSDEIRRSMPRGKSQRQFTPLDKA